MPKEFQPVIRQNSRAGCSKCKERRIKCDQARPQCVNCLVRRYTCPGYSPVLRWKEVDGLGKGSKELCSSAERSDLPLRKPNLKSCLYDSIQPESVGCLPFPYVKHCRINGELLSTKDLAGNNCATLSRTISPTFTYSPTLIPDRQTTLLWHYFGSVCVINSCCDASLDPLRSMTHDLMSSSRLIYFCILSMSAAHLRRVDPQWSLDSAEYLSETVSTLRKQLATMITDTQTATPPRQTVEQTLLGVIMLGMSTSWHGTSGLGLEHIQGSRALFRRYIYRRTSNDVSPSEWPKLSFYLGLQAYWESIASFLLDQDMDQLDTLHAACTSLPVEATQVNPWTGVDSTLWVLLAKAGCLVRKRRTLLLHKRTQISENLDGELESHLQLLDQQALALEAQILSYTTLDVSRFDVTEDNRIMISHLELIARCCKYAALLELYQAFSSTCNVTAGLRTLMTTNGAWLSEPVAQAHLAVPHAYRALALGMLMILRSIPRDSNTKCLHALFLLIAGSALSTGPIGVGRHEQPPLQQSAGLSSDPSCAALVTRASLMTCESLRFWRKFVQERMTYLESAINLDGMRRIKEILSKVWDYNDSLEFSSIDLADNDLVQFVHWVDIMEAYELEFLF